MRAKISSFSLFHIPPIFVSLFEYHFWAQIAHEQNRSKFNLAHLLNTVMSTQDTVA